MFWPLLGGPLRLRAATAHAVGRGLRFDAPAVVSREFRCVSTLPLWFRANSLPLWFHANSGFFLPALASSGGAAYASRNSVRGGAVDAPAAVVSQRSRCGFARIPLRFDAAAVVSREFRPLLACSSWGGRLGCWPQRRTRWGGRRSRCGFARIPLRFDASAVVSHELSCVSTLPLWFRATSVAFRRSRCGFARIPLRVDAPTVVSREFRPLLACSGLFRGGHLGSHELLYFWSPGVSLIFSRPLLASFGLFWPSSLFGVYAGKVVLVVLFVVVVIVPAGGASPTVTVGVPASLMLFALWRCGCFIPIVRCRSGGRCRLGCTTCRCLVELCCALPVVELVAVVSAPLSGGSGRHDLRDESVSDSRTSLATNKKLQMTVNSSLTHAEDCNHRFSLFYRLGQVSKILGRT